MKSKIKGIGMIFPIMQIGMAVVIGIFKSDAANSPPRSSSIGNIEMIKTTTSADTYCPKVLVKNSTKDSIILKYPVMR